MIFSIWLEIPERGGAQHIGLMLKADDMDHAVKRAIGLILGEWEYGECTIRHIHAVLDEPSLSWFEEHQANGRLWL